MKGKDNYTKIYTGYQGAGRDVYVINSSYDNFERVLKGYRKHYDMTSIFRQMVSLNAAPLQGLGLNPSDDIRIAKSGYITMHYSLFNGAVYIDFLHIGKPVPTEAFGLYPVAYDEGRKGWAPKQEPVDTLDPTQQWKSRSGQAHYAAVAGRFDNKEDAGALLHAHVVGAYTKSDFLTTSDAKSDFSMFWIKPGHHKSFDAAQALASIMQQSSQSSLAVNWLIHDAAPTPLKSPRKYSKPNPWPRPRNVRATKLPVPCTIKMCISPTPTPAR